MTELARAARWTLLSLSTLLAACGPRPSTKAPHGEALEAPRTTAPLDLAALAARIGEGAPALRPIFPTLPAHARAAIEARMSAFVTSEQRLREIERRRAAFELRDDDSAQAFGELMYLLEGLALGPASDARAEALSRLASLYGIAARTSNLSRWAERLARKLGQPQREGEFTPFVRAFTEDAAGMHRACVAATLRAGAPRRAVSRALSSYAWFVHAAGDLEQALSLREAAARVDPDQPAEAWLTLGTAYVVTLDAARAQLALDHSLRAPADPEQAATLAKRRDELARQIARARAVHAAGEPTTPEAWLTRGQALFELGADARAEATLTRARALLPSDARPRVALARLALRHSEDKDLSAVARQITASLDAARKLEHRTSELYELLIGLSGLTAVEEVLSGSQEPTEVARRAGVVLGRLRAVNAEHAGLAPERAAVLGVVLDLGEAGLAEGPRFLDALPGLLRAAHPRARAVLAEHPTDPAARTVGVGLAAFAADSVEGFEQLVAPTQVPDPPDLVVTRAEIALDLALSRGDAAWVDRAVALAASAPKGELAREARVAAIEGDAAVFHARAGKATLPEAERRYRDALRGLPSGEQTRVKANLAWVLAETGHLDLAADAYRDAVSSASKQTVAATALVAMATLALQARQLDDALSLADRALSLDGDSVVAKVVRATALLRLGRPDDAREPAAQALQRIDHHSKVLPARLWGQTGAFGDATLDFHLGIGSESPRYNLRLSAFHRVWWLRQPLDLTALRSLVASPKPRR